MVKLVMALIVFALILCGFAVVVWLLVFSEWLRFSP